MIWPFDAIASMPGLQFLLLYAGVIGVTLAACCWLTRELDPTGALPPLAVPGEPDPHEIAYLRGGANELTRLMIFELLEKGYLQVTGEKGEQRIAQSADHPGRAALSTSERILFDWFAGSQTVKDVFQSTGPVSALDQAATYRQRLENEHLLATREAQDAAWRIGLIGVSLLVGLGGFKLLAARATGHPNVAYLVMLASGSVVALYVACRSPRLSKRGRKYLEMLQTAFRSHRPEELVSGVVGQVSPALLLLFALFGVGTLEGTPYAYATELFHQSASGWSFSLSGDGCGSCGGGCDGCGGCGCGD